MYHRLIVTGLAALIAIGVTGPVAAQRSVPKPSLETMKQCLSFNILFEDMEKQEGRYDRDRARYIEGWSGLLVKEYGNRATFEREMRAFAEKFVFDIVQRVERGAETEIVKIVTEHTERCAAFEQENFPDPERDDRG